jgi:putative intracellular protease/amidase
MLRWALVGSLLVGLATRGPAVAGGTPVRPLVAVAALNDGTETTDFLVPFGTLAGADVAGQPWPRRRDCELHPAGDRDRHDVRDLRSGLSARRRLRRRPRDASQRRRAAPDRLQQQAALGATIVGICDGVWVLAGAGLLDGRTATGHWYSLPSLRRTYPGVHWVDDRRYVTDGPVMTTTGVTASLPASVALVERIGGNDAARAAAARLGIGGADPAHDGGAFRLSARHVWTGATNELLFWRHEIVAVPVRDGVDEIALALTADPFGRTYRTTVLTVADAPGPVRSRHGLTILPDASSSARPADRVQPADAEPPAAALDRALAAIGGAYGPDTARLVRLQLEYPDVSSR